MEVIHSEYLSVLIFIINTPFIFRGVKQISRKFVFKIFIAIAALSLAVEFIHFPVVTQDKLLVAAMRGSSVIDGTEVSC